MRTSRDVLFGVVCVRVAAAKGVESTIQNYRPIVRKTVSYIVAAVLLNEREDVSALRPRLA